MMADEVIKGLWDVKDNIAREHGDSIDGLADFILEKQSARIEGFDQTEKEEKAGPGIQPGCS